MSQSITVIIPTFNAGNLFQDVVNNLQSQSLFHQTELIIVDSGSNDNTVKTAKNVGAFVHIIDQNTFNHGGTRNLGASLGKGKYICFLTQDAVPSDPAFLETMMNTIISSNAAACFARQIPRKNASPLIRRDLDQWIGGSPYKKISQFSNLKTFLQIEPIEKYYSCVFDNVASMIRRDVWEKIPFPHTPFGEDMEWAFRALCNGYSIAYEPKAVVEHSHERSSTYMYKRTFVDHYRLNELFGVRTIPGIYHVGKSILSTTVSDWRYLIHQFEPTAAWLHWMKDVPLNAWASAWGQYYGAKAAASGTPIFQSKDV